MSAPALIQPLTCPECDGAGYTVHEGTCGYGGPLSPPEEKRFCASCQGTGFRLCADCGEPAHLVASNGDFICNDCVDAPAPLVARIGGVD